MSFCLLPHRRHLSSSGSSRCRRCRDCARRFALNSPLRRLPSTEAKVEIRNEAQLLLALLVALHRGDVRGLPLLLLVVLLAKKRSSARVLLPVRMMRVLALVLVLLAVRVTLPLLLLLLLVVVVVVVLLLLVVLRWRWLQERRR